MFSKKAPGELSATTEASESLFQDKADNYKFLKLVQDQKYEEAYTLGQIILKKTPESVAISKFCMFIEQNQPELKQMVEEEKQDAELTSDSEEEQGDDDEDDQGQDQEDSEDSLSESSQSQTQKPKKDKEKGKKCDTHQWPHICKNPFCPNKAKN